MQASVLAGDLQSVSRLWPHFAGEEHPATVLQPAGNPRYWAPEVFHMESLHPGSDLWACGVLLYRLLSAGEFPYWVRWWWRWFRVRA